MLALAFESALRSVVRTPGVSLLVVMAIALGVGITMPMVTLSYNSGGAPLKENSDRIHRVLIDNWTLDGIYYTRDPEFPTEILSPRDAKALATSDIPAKTALSYAAYQYVGAAEPSSNLRPFYAEIRATSTDFFSMFGLPLAEGAIWSEEADASRQNVAVISSATNARIFGGGSSVGKQFKVAGEIYTVVGVLKPWALTPRVYDLSQTNARPEAVYVPLSDFQRSNLFPNRWRTLDDNIEPVINTEFLNSETIYAQLWVLLESEQAVLAYRDYLDVYVAEQKALGRLPRPLNNALYSAREWVDIAPGNRGTKQLYSVFIIVGVFFLLVCLFNLLSLLLAKFTAAAPQACVLRALGASRGVIFTQYVIEVVMLGVLGGLLSIFVAKVALKGMFWVYLNNLPAEFKQVQSVDSADSGYIQFDTQLLVYAFALAIIAALLSALYPAWKSCRIPPAEFLKMN